MCVAVLIFFLRVLYVCVRARAGADPSARTSRGHQALHLAAENGHTETARMLIDSGADLNAKDGVRAYACIHEQEESQVQSSLISDFLSVYTYEYHQRFLSVRTRYTTLSQKVRKVFVMNVQS